jgi:hypothetical protein
MSRRLPWFARPLWAASLGLMMLAAVVGACAIIYARQRLAAIKFVESTGGSVTVASAPVWYPRWRPMLVLVCSAEQLELAPQSPDDLERIQPLHEVRRMTLRGPGADDKLLRGISRFRRLENLYFRDSAVTDVGLARLRDCPRLRVLDMSGMAISDRGLGHLAGLSLEGLCLDGTPITDAGLKHLSALPLHELFLGNTRISDAGLKHLAGLPLTFLSLTHTGISDAGLRRLAGTPLRELMLDGTPITDAGAEELASWSLERLHLRGTRISARALPRFHAMKTLRYLGLSSPPFTASDVSALSHAHVDVTLN